VHLNTPSTHPFPEIEISGFPLETQSKFDLGVFCRDTGFGTATSWVYNPDLFDAATIARMARQYQKVLEITASNSNLRLSQVLETLATDERQRLTDARKEFQEASLLKLKGMRRRPAPASEQE
jgi:non-ribosomal peptide synthetase component F